MHKHKEIHIHVQNGIFDTIFATNSPQPDGKQDGRCFVRHVAFDYVHMRSGSKWSMIGPWPCAYAYGYVDLVFTSQSYDISISTTTNRTNLSIFLVFMLMLNVDPVFTCIHMCLCLCSHENQA